MWLIWGGNKSFSPISLHPSTLNCDPLILRTPSIQGKTRRMISRARPLSSGRQAGGQEGDRSWSLAYCLPYPPFLSHTPCNRQPPSRPREHPELQYVTCRSGAPGLGWLLGHLSDMQAELMGVSSTPQDLLLEILTSQMHLRRMHPVLFASCIWPLRVIPGKGAGGGSFLFSVYTSFLRSSLPSCSLTYLLLTLVPPHLILH